MSSFNYTWPLVIGAFFFSFSLFAFSPQDISKIESLKLWESSEWKKLMHDERSWFGDKSESDSKNFFLHKEGKTNYKLELLELATTVTKPAKDNQDPRCHFPARTKWLYSKLDKPLPNNFFEKCTDYLKFKQLVEAQNVSIIFSSYYLESPASAFGHTLLKFSRKKSKYTTDTKLLDMGVNYSASVTTDNALLYAFFGLVGLFEGRYSAIPYFYKVREYSDHESRDLWEYTLNLKEEHIDRLQDHLWEVGNTFFYYYYFTENCSYNLLTLLDVANFDLNLVAELPDYYTIPSHTVRIINSKKGLVSKIEATPSNRKVFEFNFKELNETQKNLLLKSYEDQNISYIQKSSLSYEQKTQLVDTLMLHVDFKHSADVLLGKGEISKWKNQILIYRSELGHSTVKTKNLIQQSEAPHLGHDPRRVMFGYDAGARGRTKFEFRPALHSFMDSHIGQPEFATLEFFDFGFSSSKDGLDIDKVDLVEVMALNPITEYSTPFSLKAKFGWANEEIFCDNCTSFNIELAGGVSTQIKNGLLYTFMGIRSLHTEELVNSHKLLIAPEVGVKLGLSDKWSTLLTAKYNRDSTDKFNYGEFSTQVNYYLEHSLRLQLDYNAYEFNNQSIGFNCYMYY